MYPYSGIFVIMRVPTELHLVWHNRRGPMAFNYSRIREAGDEARRNDPVGSGYRNPALKAHNELQFPLRGQGFDYQ